jgi:type II secretory pathway pseudopilin PulG
VELLVVIAIIGILVALLLPAVQAAREAARRMQCGNNLKQIGLALHNYHDKYKTFPQETIWHGNAKGTTCTAADVRHYTWITLLLPNIEQGPLHDQINFSIPALAPSALYPAGQFNAILVQGKPLKETLIPAFLCPSSPMPTDPPHGLAYSSYGGNSGWHGYRYKTFDPQAAGPFSLYDACRIEDITDGTSNTILVGEVGNTSYTPGQQWVGGSGTLRKGNNGVFRSLLVTTSSWPDPGHGWIATAGKGPQLLRADGTTGGLWGQWAAPYVMSPVYYAHYSQNVEWPGTGSQHPGGSQYCRADGSVTTVARSVATGANPQGDAYGRFGNVWTAMHTISGPNGQAQVVWGE